MKLPIKQLCRTTNPSQRILDFVSKSSNQHAGSFLWASISSSRLIRMRRSRVDSSSNKDSSFSSWMGYRVVDLNVFPCVQMQLGFAFGVGVAG